MTGERCRVGLVLLLVLGGVAAARGEEVHVSRYRWEVSATANTTVREPVASAVLNGYCGDDDGCAVVLAYQNGSDRIIAQTRLIVSGATWSTPEFNPIAVDSSGNDTVVQRSLEGTCRFSDIDFGGADDSFGFTVAAEAADDAITCILTLID